MPPRLRKQQLFLLLLAVLAGLPGRMPLSEAQALDLAPDTSEGPVAYVTETPGREWGASGETTVSFLDALKNNSVQRILVVDDISVEALHREMASSAFQPVQINRYVPAAAATAV